MPSRQQGVHISQKATYYLANKIGKGHEKVVSWENLCIGKNNQNRQSHFVFHRLTGCRAGQHLGFNSFCLETTVPRWPLRAENVVVDFSRRLVLIGQKSFFFDNQHGTSQGPASLSSLHLKITIRACHMAKGSNQNWSNQDC